jgi:hypothetical protein
LGNEFLFIISKIKMLSNDVLFMIAMRLDLVNLFRFAKTCSVLYDKIWNNRNIWRRKLLKDYPDYEIFKLNRSSKNTYIFLHKLSFLNKIYRCDDLYDLFCSKELDLSNENLTKLPALDLPNIEVLDLSNNYLKTLSNLHLPNLRRLYLYDNRIDREETERLKRKYGNKLIC